MIPEKQQTPNINTIGNWQLKVFESGQSTEYNLDQSKRYSIGRESSVDIILINSEASRKHAELFFQNGQWVVKDLGSTNGVKVKQKKVSTAVLVGGDSFDISSTTLTLLSSASHVEEDGTVYNTTSVAPAPKPTKNNSKILYIAATVSIIVIIAVFLKLFVIDVKQEVGETSSVEHEVTTDLPNSTPTPSVSSENNTVHTPHSTTPILESGVTVQEYYRLGLLSYDHGHLKKAIGHWNRALLLDRDNDLIIQKVSRATEELEYQISERYRSAKNHLKYLRYHEAEQNFMIVMELVQDEKDSKFIDAKKQLERIRKK